MYNVIIQLDTYGRVDTMIKEPLSLSQNYLTEEEFKTVFGMSFQEFRGKPKWKQNDLKKKVDLF